MEKKVMTKGTYTEIIRLKGAVQMLSAVIETASLGATLGMIDTSEDVINIMIGVYNEQLKVLNEMLINLGIMKDENDSNSLNDVIDNTVIIEEVQ